MSRSGDSSKPQTKEECLPLIMPPSMQRGELKTEGNYFRNINASDLSRRYPKDENLTYGVKVKVKKWRWTDKEGQFGLSVNCCKCISCPQCSLLFENEEDRHEHVVELNLEVLNERLSIPVVAQYQPEGENICHFNFLPEDGSIQVNQLNALLSKLDKVDPPFPEHQPSLGDEKQQHQAFQAKKSYQQLFKIHYSPLKK